MQKSGKYHLLKKIANFTINSLDLFGQAPEFRINKQTKFSTCFGVLFSVLLAVITFSYLLMELNDMFLYINPTVVSTQMQVSETPTYPLLSNNFTIAVSVGNLQMTSLKTINKHFTINMKNCLRERITDPLTNVTKVTSNCTVVPMETCTLDNFLSKVSQETFKNVRLGTVQCIQKDYLKSNAPVLQGAFSAVVHQYLLITLEACVNTTTKNDCSPIEEIQKGMEAGYYHIYYTDNLIRMDQHGKPFEELISQISTTFSIYSSKQIYQDFMIAEARSDEGLVLPDYIQQQGLIAAQFREAQEFYNENYIVQHLIKLDYRNTQYNRSYLKLQSVLSKVGGFWSVIMILCALIIRPLTNTLMNLSIVNKLFYFSNSNMLEEEKIKIKNLVNARSVDGIKENSKEVKKKQKPLKSNKLSQFMSFRFNSNKQDNNLEFIDYLDNKNKNKLLNFSTWDILKSIFMCNSKKIAQFKYAQEKFMSNLDIVNLIKKIHEIDKLKSILLNDDQLKIYNFMQRPTVTSNLDELINIQDEESKNPEKSVAQTMIIEEEKPQIVKLQQAFQAYKSITKQKMHCQINQKLLNLLDNDVLELFVNMIHNEAQTVDYYHRQLGQENDNASQQIQNELYPISCDERTPNTLIVNQEIQD